jgi:hypothetical protein
MVRPGWLVVRDGRYEITPERERAAKERELNHLKADRSACFAAKHV